MFLSKNKDGQDEVFRTRKMNTYIGKSLIDGKDSFHLDYSPHNSGTVHSIHDELRKISDNIFPGMGYMGIGGGSINPTPFLIIGPAVKWVGPDKQQAKKRLKKGVGLWNSILPSSAAVSGVVYRR